MRKSCSIPSMWRDDKLLGCYLPKLTIQPLIENSIVHGLEPKRHGGWVRVSIWEEEDAVYIRVNDDGVGFDPSAIPSPAATTSTT